MVKGNADQAASSTIMSSLLLWHIFKNSFNLGGYTGLNISIPRAASKKNSASKQSRQLYYHYSQHMCQLFPGPLCLNGSNLWLAERKHITLSVCCLHTGPLLRMFPKQSLFKVTLKQNLTVCSCSHDQHHFQKGRDRKTSKQPL